MNKFSNISICLGLVALSLSLSGATLNRQEVDEHTVLLLHFNREDGSRNFVDDSVAGNHTVTALGDAQIDTEQYKFGGSSAFFDGDPDYTVGDFLAIPDSDDWFLFGGDFTVDFWIRLNSLGKEQDICGQREGGKVWIISILPNNLFYIYEQDNGVKVEIMTKEVLEIAPHAWYHIAVVRSGKRLYVFLDGVSQRIKVKKSFNGNNNIVSPLHIGQHGWGGSYLDGWLDEFRISKGVARWTSNFTPPEEEYYPSPVYIPPFAEAPGEEVLPEEPDPSEDDLGWATNERGESSLAVRVIFLAIIAISLFVFLKKRSK